jgi:hypothetical protein
MGLSASVSLFLTLWIVVTAAEAMVLCIDDDDNLRQSRAMHNPQSRGCLSDAHRSAEINKSLNLSGNFLHMYSDNWLTFSS